MPDPLPSYKELTLRFGEYPFVCPEGIWRARLVAKAWGKARNLLLYFRAQETDKGHCIAVFHGTFYAPINRGINFRSMAKIDQIFELETGKTRTGRTKFISARIITGPESEPATREPACGESLTPAS